jgi:hypothetical protein
LWVADLHLASGVDGGVAHGHERADSGAVQERDPGQVDVKQVGTLVSQHTKQPLAQDGRGCQVDLSDYGDPGYGRRRVTGVDV